MPDDDALPARVLACGLATLDVMQSVDHVPGPNEKVVAGDLVVAAGGPAANAAVTCATLGVPARLVTRIGDGPLGSVVHADLAAARVEVLDLAEAGAEPPVSTVLLTRGTGERAVVSVNATRHDDAAMPARVRDDAAMPARVWDDVAMPARVWDDVVVVLVDGHQLDLAIALATEAGRRGIPVVLDGGSWKPGLEALLALVDVAVVSADFAVPGDVRPVDAARRDTSDDAARADTLNAVSRLGPRVVAQSHGAEPIVLRANDRSVVPVPVPVVEVADTLGAGDVLHGALVAWVAARGCPDDMDADGWRAALGWAAGLASASCGAGGARGWTSDAEIVARWRAELSA